MGNGEGFKKRENVPAKKGQTLSLYDGKIQDVSQKKLQLKQFPPKTEVVNATFNFVPYMQTINLVTTFDLVTLFGLTKSVTKSEVDCNSVSGKSYTITVHLDH